MIETLFKKTEATYVLSTVVLHNVKFLDHSVFKCVSEISAAHEVSRLHYVIV